MRKPPFHYVWGRPYDDDLPNLVRFVKHVMEKNNDDFRLLIVGETGTGKSTLAMHIDELFRGDKVCIETYGLNEKTYARAIKHAKELRASGEPWVSCVYDEANVYGVEAMKKFNISLTRMMAEIRGLKVLHIWCMPNPELLPGNFLDSTFNAIIFIFDKGTVKPRLYDYLGRRNIDDLRQKEGSKTRKARLSLDLLRKNHRKYAMYRGCFKKYEGVLLEPYLALKNTKIDDRIDSFFEEFGEQELLSKTQMAALLGVSEKTFENWFVKAFKEGLILEGKHFIKNGAGKVRFPTEGQEFFKEYQRKKIQTGGGVALSGFSGSRKLNNARPETKRQPAEAEEVVV